MWAVCWVGAGAPAQYPCPGAPARPCTPLHPGPAPALGRTQLVCWLRGFWPGQGLVLALSAELPSTEPQLTGMMTRQLGQPARLRSPTSAACKPSLLSSRSVAARGLADHASHTAQVIAQLAEDNTVAAAVAATAATTGVAADRGADFLADLFESILTVLDNMLETAHVPYSYGFAIILLTIMVKAITFPLSKKQVESTVAMQALQPSIKELQAKYAGDQETLQLETSRLYKDAGVNPLAGCLPTLATIPVFIGLYKSLSNAASDGLLTEDFFWIPSLAGPTTIAARASVSVKGGATCGDGVGDGFAGPTTIVPRASGSVGDGAACGDGVAGPATIAARASVSVGDGAACGDGVAGPATVVARESGGGLEWLWPFVDGHPPIGWPSAGAYLVMPVLLVLSQFWSQKYMQPPQQEGAEPNPSTAILKFLPLMIGWFSLNVPSGLTLYWFVNNILSTAQQVYLKSNVQVNLPTKSAAVSNSVTSSNGAAESDQGSRGKKKKGDNFRAIKAREAAAKAAALVAQAKSATPPAASSGSPPTDTPDSPPADVKKE
eukprot:gene13718-19613_t